MEERKLSLSSPPTGTSSRHEGMPDNPSGAGMSFLSVLVWGTPIKESTPILPGVDSAICV